MKNGEIFKKYEYPKLIVGQTTKKITTYNHDTQKADVLYSSIDNVKSNPNARVQFAPTYEQKIEKFKGYDFNPNTLEVTGSNNYERIISADRRPGEGKGLERIIERNLDDGKKWSDWNVLFDATK